MKKVIKFVKGKKEEDTSRVPSADSKKSEKILDETPQQQPIQHPCIAGGGDAELEEFLSADKSITKLHKAVWAENTDKLRSIIKTHDIDITDRLDRTALYYAVLKDNAALAELLLENGASHSIPDIDGVTPLLRAVHQGSRDCVLALIKHGADLKRVDKDSNGCLHYAVSARRHSLLSLLVNQAADCNQHNNVGECPLHVAARLGESEMAETLLTFGAVTDVADSRGVTALMAAAAAGHADIIALLLSHQADTEVKDSQGKTAADHALTSGYRDIALKLRSSGSRPSSQNESDSPVSTPPSRRVAEPRDKQLARIAEKLHQDEPDASEEKSESDVSVKRSENASPQSGVIPPPCKPLRSLEYLQAGRSSCAEERPLHLLTLGTVRTRHVSMTESDQSRGATPHRFSYHGESAAPDLVAYCCPPHEPPIAAPRHSVQREEGSSTVPSDWGSSESLAIDEPRKCVAAGKDNTFLQKQFSLLEDYEKKHSRTCSAVSGADDSALVGTDVNMSAQLERYNRCRSLPRNCQSQNSYRGSMSLPRTLDCGRDFIRDMKRYGSYRPPTKTHYIYKRKTDTITTSKKHGFIDKLKNMFGKKAQIHLSDSTDANQTWLQEDKCGCTASQEPPLHCSECTRGYEKKMNAVGSSRKSSSSVETPAEGNYSPSQQLKKTDKASDVTSLEVFCPECSEYATQKIAEVQREIIGRDSLINLLQKQLEKMQERNIHSINETQEITFKYYQANQELVSVRALTHKYEEEVRRLLAERCRDTHHVVRRRCHSGSHPAAASLVLAKDEHHPDKWKTQCRELEVETETLRSENARMSSQVCELQCELSRATQRLLELEQTLTTARRELDNELRDKNKQLEVELDRVRAGYEKLQAIYGETEKAFNESIDQHGNVISENESLKEQNVELKERLGELGRRVSCMRSSAVIRNSVLRAELEKSNVPCCSLPSCLVSTPEERSSHELTTVDYEKPPSGKRVTFEEPSKELACIRLENIETTMCQIERLNDEYSEMHLRLQEAGIHERMEKVNNENCRLEDKIEEQFRDVSRLENLTAELREENIESYKRIEELLEENDQLKKGFEEMLTEIENLRADAKVKAAGVKQQDAVYVRQKERAEAQVRDIEERLKILQAEHDKKCCKITALEVANSEANAKVISFEEQVEHITSERERIQKDLDRYERQNNELKEKLECSRDSVSRLETGLLETHRNLERLQEANEQLKASAEKACEEARTNEHRADEVMKNLSVRLQEIDEENGHLVAQVEMARSRCECLEEQVETLSIKNETERLTFQEQLRRQQGRQCRLDEENAEMKTTIEILQSILDENLESRPPDLDLEKIASEIFYKLKSTCSTGKKVPRKMASRIPTRLSTACKKVSMQTSLSEIGETDSRSNSDKHFMRSISFSDKSIGIALCGCSIRSINSHRSSSMPNLETTDDDAGNKVSTTTYYVNPQAKKRVAFTSKSNNTIRRSFSLEQLQKKKTRDSTSSRLAGKGRRATICSNPSCPEDTDRYRELIIHLQRQVAELQERATNEAYRNYDLETELNDLKSSVASVADMDKEIIQLRTQLDRERATRSQVKHRHSFSAFNGNSFSRIQEFEIAKIRKEEELREFRQKIKQEFLLSKDKLLADLTKAQDSLKAKTVDEVCAKMQCDKLKKETEEQRKKLKESSYQSCGCARQSIGETSQEWPAQQHIACICAMPAATPGFTSGRALRFQLDNTIKKYCSSSGATSVTRSQSDEELVKKYLLK